MTLRGDGNKNRRTRPPMSKRATWIVIVIAVAVVVLAFVIVVAVVSGKGMF